MRSPVGMANPVVLRFILTIFSTVPLIVPSCNSKSILFIAYHNAPSHVATMLPYAKSNSATQTNFGDKIGVIFANIPRPMIEDLLTGFIWTSNSGGAFMSLLFAFGGIALWNLNQAQPDTLRMAAHGDWDLIIADHYSVTAFPIVNIQRNTKGTPHIILGTSPMSLLSEETGRNPVTGPYPIISHSLDANYDPGDLFHRCWNLANWFLEYITVTLIVYNPMLLPGCYRNGFHISDHYRTATAFFSSAFDRHLNPFPVDDKFVSIGARCESADDQQMSGETRRFIEDINSRGTIYVAFGTCESWKSIPRNIVETFADVLNEFSDYRVIFAYKGPPITVKSHVKLMPWSPQTAILSHFRTLLFLSHGGLKSVREAICSLVPLVIMPINADHGYHTYIAKQSGFAEIVDRQYLDANSLREAISKILADWNRYQDKIRKYNAIFLDRVILPEENVNFIVGRILKNPKIFKGLRKDVGWFQWCLSCQLLSLIFPFMLLS